MNAPGISVIIPTYNRARLVARAVQGILPLVNSDDEIIVVDDASTDDTEAALAPYRDRVRYLRVEHGGAGRARNQGILAAGKPLVAFLDSDDEWMPDKLLLERAFMEKMPEVLFCFSDFAGRDEQGDEHHYLRHWHNDPRPWDEILGRGVLYSALAPLPPGRADFRCHIGDLFLPELLSDYVATSTMMVRRELAGGALHFAEDLRVSEDKECFARLAQAGPAAYLDCETSYQWGHGGERLTDANAHELACARLILMERIWARDEEFMAQYGALFAQKKTEQLLKKARWLIVRGRMREARAALHLAPESPFSYRFLAALPGPLVRGILGCRRALVGAK